jgi:hypothetical protein
MKKNYDVRWCCCGSGRDDTVKSGWGWGERGWRSGATTGERTQLVTDWDGGSGLHFQWNFHALFSASHQQHIYWNAISGRKMVLCFCRKRFCPLCNFRKSFFYANLGRDFFGLFIFSTVFSGYPLTQMWKQII